MEQEKLKDALIAVRDKIQVMGPEEFRKELDNVENNDIATALALLQDFSEFIHDEEKKK